jgi:hypothetical protein
VTPQVPTAADLLSDPIVCEALEAAWLDSLPLDPIHRHEEGGWVYMDLASGQISIRRQQAAERASIDLSSPPLVAGSLVVGKFHTHPNPSAEGWEPGPSPQDQVVDHAHGVPDLIRADNGIHTSGPDSRRGGLAGEAGYPG